MRDAASHSPQEDTAPDKAAAPEDFRTLLPQMRVREEEKDWYCAVLGSMESRLSDDPDFPCIFSKNAFRKQLLAFVFVEEIDAAGMRHLAAGLSEYIEISKKWDGSLSTAYPLVVPLANGQEAALACDGGACTARTLLEVCALLSGARPPTLAQAAEVEESPMPDLRDVRGQLHARRALEVAAAGGHHLLFVGAPGCGKTLLASRLPGILPLSSESQALESAGIASVSGRGLDPARWRQRPFRSPHHTASAVALVGGGCEFQPITRLSSH